MMPRKIANRNAFRIIAAPHGLIGLYQTAMVEFGGAGSGLPIEETVPTKSFTFRASTDIEGVSKTRQVARLLIIRTMFAGGALLCPGMR